MFHFVVVFCALFLTTVQAAPEAVTSDKVAKVSSMSEGPVGAAELANITLALFFVLALLFLLAWLFRRYGNIASLNRSNIQVLGGVSLGHRERAVLLEVEGERILVGVAQGHVSKLHVLEKKDDIDDEYLQPEIVSNDTKSFADKLKQVINPGEGEQR
jgi:flagellar protein FliO/FliZ